MSYIPQDPGTALNPALRIGTQLPRSWRHTRAGSSSEERAGARARRSRRWRFPPTTPSCAATRTSSPAASSSVAIAMAFANRPKVIVCDEPTTGLDVTTQARVLETVRDLCRSHRVAALYVSHDLAVVAELADCVAVMYGGRIVESGPRERIFSAPRHRTRSGCCRSAGHRREAQRRRNSRSRRPARQPAGRVLLPPALPVRSR